MATTSPLGWAELEVCLKQRLEELRDEAREFNDPEPTTGACGALMALCRALQPALAERRLPMPSVFLRDGGLLELIVPNPPLSRRMQVQFGADGSNWSVNLLDGRGMVDGPHKASGAPSLKPAWVDWLAPIQR